jgi:hypothetical protein
MASHVSRDNRPYRDKSERWKPNRQIGRSAVTASICHSGLDVCWDMAQRRQRVAARRAILAHCGPALAPGPPGLGGIWRGAKDKSARFLTEYLRRGLNAGVRAAGEPVASIELEGLAALLSISVGLLVPRGGIEHNA